MAIRVYVSKVSDDKSHDDILPYLGADKRAEILKLRKLEDRQRALKAQWLIRSVICRTLGIPFERIEIAADEMKKPFLVNDPSFHFNVSHSGRLVACAAGDSPVGIDVEQMVPVNVCDASPFFSKQEMETLMTLPESGQHGRFFEIWTLKESFLKAKGTGLLEDPSVYTVTHGPETVKIIMGSMELPWHFRAYVPEEGYRMAVCSTCSSIGDIVTI